MDRVPGSTEGARSSALWGKRSSGERSSALWGKGGRGLLAVTTLAVAMVVPSTGAAASGKSCGDDLKAYVPASLLKDACAKKTAKFNVIVQAEAGKSSGRVAREIARRNGSVKRTHRAIIGASARLPGAAILGLARDSAIFAITRDARVESTYEDAEMWRQSTRVDQLWGALDPLTGLISDGPKAPAIAVVDSGVDASKLEAFGTRLKASVNLSSLSPGAIGDDQGHGTMVAGVAAGADPMIPGVAQNADIVSIRTSDANGQSVTSDVIAAADWILANRTKYGIRVANFSLGGSVETSFRFDPMDKAVERLWFAGVVVVAAAGNHGSGSGPVSMAYAPANDPFIITVGATDQHMSSDPGDDTRPAWSAYGYTADGFLKPDVAAPGRYMALSVPETSTIALAFPHRVLAPGYMWMSGTSFSAPVVAGAAAQILARNPDWTPDQVKGALMLTTYYLGEGLGVGTIDAAAAAAVENPPNPNENLVPFVLADELNGGYLFDEASWAKHVNDVLESGASWAQASWAHASWAQASWAQASWAQASWAQASWAYSSDSLMTSAATDLE